MQYETIRNRLIEEGQKQFSASPAFHKFTGNPEADEMMNDIKSFPHAFVLGAIMDRQVKYERAWIIPYKIRKRLGDFSMNALAELSLRDIRRLMSEPEPLHRFVEIMSKNFYAAIERISRTYQGDASRIWLGNPSSADVVYRFLQFNGVGPKIATMAANLLVRVFKVPLSEYSSIDVSADVHVRRVLERLGLCEGGASVVQAIYKARALNPGFPGIIDSPLFDIGRNHCRPTNPACGECAMNGICPSSRPGGKKKLSKTRANNV